MTERTRSDDAPSSFKLAHPDLPSLVADPGSPATDMPRSPSSSSPTKPAAAARAKPSTRSGVQRTRGDIYYDLDRSVGYLLNRAASIIAARFSDDLKAHGVNLQTWRVLAALNFENNQSMTELANHTGSELSYLSRSVASAEQRGLVERVASTSDKRAVVLALTPIGLALVKELSPYGHQIEKTSMTGVSKSDVETTLRTLHAIYHNLVDSTEASSDMNRKLTVARRAKKRSLTDPGQ
jgi:DNA-binding MarR family transcriptional regulator